MINSAHLLVSFCRGSSSLRRRRRPIQAGHSVISKDFMLFSYGMTVLAAVVLTYQVFSYELALNKELYILYSLHDS